MGRYLNPKDMSKEEWLKKHAIAILADTPPASPTEEGHYVVCYSVNPGFSAAALMHNKEELRRFSAPDPRLKLWFLIEADDAEYFQ